MGREIALLVVASLGLSLSFSSTATATTYRSASNQTTVVLHEKTTSPSGYYFTTTNGRNWLGNIQISSVEEATNSRTYTGTFRDFTLGPEPRKTCEGNISITRQQIDRNSWHQISASWQVTGGETCDTIGQTYTLDLIEPIPVADRNGDFTAANSNTWQTETAGEATWLAWKVTSSDGQLNCRTSPNGEEIATVYTSDEEIQIEGRAVNAIVTDDAGRPWLWTNRGCYVRANQQYIEPIPLPW